jgi:hypothetical protein
MPGHSTCRELALPRAASLRQHGLFGHSHVAVVVVLSTRIAEQRPVGGAIFRAGIRERVPTMYLGELASLRQRLKQMLADVVHSIGLGLFRVSEPVNPDRLRHIVPPASSSTVAHAQRRKHLPGGPDVLPWQPGLDVETQGMPRPNVP